ncbi:MAG TPA: MipA/OmpV family protein [Acidiferrobacterales bacterium]|nr:MipA/OmpV family protein [Acidiferrobacterales bacterium]
MCLRRGLAAVLLVFAAGTSLAGEKPLWELGLGFFALTSPDYRGSDESRGYLLPLPYVIYRGDILRIDRSGIYSRLFETDRVHLDLSADAGVPVDSSKNSARLGMPNLDMVFEVGPVLEVCLWRTCAGDRKLQFRLPVRAVFSTDFGSIESRGGSTHPNLNFDIKNIGSGGGWNFGLAAGPLYATERLHDYYYEVAPLYATGTRPAYDARAGYSGSRVTLALSKRFQRVWFGAFARYDTLAGATFEDSPLVRRDRAFMAGFGVAWIFAESGQLVDVEVKE